MYCTIIFPLRDSLGITNAEYVVLDTISHLSHNIQFNFWCVASARQLSEYTTYSHATVSRSIQRLEEIGLLVKRKSSQKDTAIRPTDLWNNIINNTALIDKMKTSYDQVAVDLSQNETMKDNISQNDSSLSQNDSSTSVKMRHDCLKMTHNTYTNTYNDTKSNTEYVARASDGLKKVDSSSLLGTLTRKKTSEDVERIPPTPLLPGGEELAIDENPYGFSVPVKKPELHPFLVVLIQIAREHGCEIRWHSLQDHLREAITLWGEVTIEKEFIGYLNFVKTLTNKNVRWESFKKNRLDNLPTLALVAEVMGDRKQAASVVHAKKMPEFNVDAWQYHNSMKSGETPINKETLQKLSDKLAVYGDGAMKDKVIEFIRQQAI